MRRLAGVVALVVVLAGCGGGAAEPTAVVGMVEVLEGVDYYYACGNEVLELPDGRRFHPLVDQDAVDEDAYAEERASAEARVLALADTLLLAVVEPGPGDDVGTLTVYEDGMARYVSDSGTVAWLTDEELTYDFVC